MSVQHKKSCTPANYPQVIRLLLLLLFNSFFFWGGGVTYKLTSLDSRLQVAMNFEAKVYLSEALLLSNSTSVS